MDGELEGEYVWPVKVGLRDGDKVAPGEVDGALVGLYVYPVTVGAIDGEYVVGDELGEREICRSQ